MSLCFSSAIQSIVPLEASDKASNRPYDPPIKDTRAREEDLQAAGWLHTQWQSLAFRAEVRSTNLLSRCFYHWRSAIADKEPKRIGRTTVEDTMADAVDCVACGVAVSRAAFARHVQWGCQVSQGGGLNSLVKNGDLPPEHVLRFPCSSLQGSGVSLSILNTTKFAICDGCSFQIPIHFSSKIGIVVEERCV